MIEFWNHLHFAWPQFVILGLWTWGLIRDYRHAPRGSEVYETVVSFFAYAIVGTVLYFGGFWTELCP